MQLSCKQLVYCLTHVLEMKLILSSATQLCRTAALDRAPMSILIWTIVAHVQQRLAMVRSLPAALDLVLI